MCAQRTTADNVPFQPFYGSDGVDPFELVTSLNIHRRHLTAEQKRELIAKVLKAEPEKSNRAFTPWPGCRGSIRRLDRRRASVSQTLVVMKHGASLLLFYERGRPTWKLSIGSFIAPEVAAAIINHPNVTGVGDTLFAGTLSQTYRWINHAQEDHHG